MNSKDPDSPSTALGAMLEEALDRSLETSLDSLAALRHSVRVYTQHQKSRGMTLDSVMRAISTSLMDVEDERRTELTPVPVRDPALARQLRAWCSEDYTEA